MLLEVRNLRTEFFTAAGRVRAVRGVTFNLNAGEVLGIVGESGCGKSVTALSLMRLIATPGRIVSGEIVFNGRNLLALSESEMRAIRGNEIGMIFQDPMSSLNPALTIERQITEVLELHKGMRRNAARIRSAELLELVGIPDPQAHLKRFPHQLSGGMRQRVMIAMALSCEPKLLIADEATTALDVTIQAQILELIRGLQSSIGMAIIMITHDMGVVAGHADRIDVMYGGHIVEAGTANHIFYEARHPYTVGLLESTPRLGTPRSQPLQPIPGSPPDLLEPPVGCPFHPRCRYEVDRSRREMPVLVEVSHGHEVACWVDIRSSHGASTDAAVDE